MPSHEYEYDFVISYAGEDRGFAESLYDALVCKGAKVFYAPEKQAQLWGENLYEYLAEIYSKKGLFCIPLISEHYVQKHWTRHEWKSAQERALRSHNKAYILPVRLDDTELPGLLETTGYVDASSVDTLQISEMAFTKLEMHLSGTELSVSANPLLPSPEAWKYTRLPDGRNSFLLENKYLNRKAADFALNEWTSKLKKWDSEKADSSMPLVSFVAIPMPEAVDVDPNESSRIFRFDDHQSPGVGHGDEEHGEYWFGTALMYGKDRRQAEYVRYKPSARFSEHCERFLRLTDSGAVEYAMMFPAFYDRSETVFAFNLLYIVGAFWKFSCLIPHYFQSVGYQGDFQLLLNLRNTQDCLLDIFAQKANVKNWADSHDPFWLMDVQRAGISISRDQHLQFCFNISSQVWPTDVEHARKLIDSLSHKIQHSFNLDPLDRHYVYQTAEFPWSQYNLYESHS